MHFTTVCNDASSSAVHFAPQRVALRGGFCGIGVGYREIMREFSANDPAAADFGKSRGLRDLTKL